MMSSVLYKYPSSERYYQESRPVRTSRMDKREIFKRDISTSTQLGAAGGEKKPRDLRKSFSLPELSMNLTYVMRWLGRVRKYSGLEGEWKVVDHNSRYYSQYSLTQISKHIKKRHSDPWILKQSFSYGENINKE